MLISKLACPVIQAKKPHVLFDFTLRSDEAIIQLLLCGFAFFFFFSTLNHFTVVRNI